MNKFELFSMIFYSLDYYWQNYKSEDLGMFLSDMSPFTFKEIGSAIPDVYEGFCKFVKKDEIDLKDSFDIARSYVASLNRPYITEAFSWLTEESWNKTTAKYLASDHKGKELE